MQEALKQLGILPIIDFQLKVDSFCDNLKQVGLSHYFHFTLPFDFRRFPYPLFKDSLRYSLLMKFPYLLAEGGGDPLTSSRQLKSSYYLSCFSSFRQHEFECVCLIFIKSTLHFFERQFPLIQLDRELESELYVLLIQGVLGLSVSPRAYFLLVERYLAREVCFPRECLAKRSVKDVKAQAGKEAGRAPIRASVRLHVEKYTPLDQFKAEVKRELKVEAKKGRPKQVIQLKQIRSLQQSRYLPPIPIKKNISSQQISVALQGQFAKLGLQRIYTNHNVVVGTRKKQHGKIYSLTPRESHHQTKESFQAKEMMRMSKPSWTFLLKKVKKSYMDSTVQVEKLR